MTIILVIDLITVSYTEDKGSADVDTYIAIATAIIRKEPKPWLIRMYIL